MVVVPACGRIIHYAPPGEANILWENPALAARPSTKRKPARGKAAGAWVNYGGDKAWPWPQSRWPQVIDREWPPPQQLERQPHELRLVSRCAVSLTSEPLPEFGVRVSREITLATRGNRATIRTTLDPADPDVASDPSPWAAWSVTQIRTPSRIALRIDPNTDLPSGHKPLSPRSWETVKRIGADILLTRAPDQTAKFGADADILAAEIGNWLFVQKRLPDENNTGRRLSGEAAQVFASGKVSGAPGSEYVELEFTGRRAQPRPSLSVQWDLIEWNAANTDAELAVLLRTL
ncbi:hypothetical protein BH09PLA1_BH09PLA1_03460 [soil metagenome]